MSNNKPVDSGLALSVSALNIVTKGDFNLEIQNLRIAYGSRVALVGANGSGKTTLLEGILGLRSALKHDVLLLEKRTSEKGIDPSIKQTIGVQLQSASYNRNMKVEDIVQLHKLLYKQQSDRIKEAFEIEKLSKLNYLKLSRGEKQRVDLFVAMAHLPVMLIFDEPNTGLDHYFSRQLYQVIEYLYEVNPHTTVLTASHTGKDLDLASEIYWLKNGTLEESGNKNEMIEKELGAMRLEVKISNEEAVEKFRQCLSQQDRKKLIEVSSGHFIVFGVADKKKIWQRDLISFELEQFSLRSVCGDDFLKHIYGSYE